MDNQWRRVIGTLLSCAIVFSTSCPVWAAGGDDAPPLKVLSQADTASDASTITQNDADTNSEHIILQNPSTYILNPGDQITVVDYADKQQGVQTITVMPDGSVTVYPIGVLRAGGLSVQDFNSMLNERAKKYYIQPQFVVYVSQMRPVVVYVLGDVLYPGDYQLGGEDASGDLTGQGTRNSDSASAPVGPPAEVLGVLAGEASASAAEISVAPGTLTILSALQQAGGLKDSANVRQIRVTRARTKEIFEIDLWKLLVEGDTAQDLPLESGDTVFVPRGGANYDPNSLGDYAGDRLRMVRILGSVKAPGLYKLAPDDDIVSVIAKAGGFMPNAVKSKVLLSRLNRDGTITYRKVSMDKTLKDDNYIGRVPVRPNDVVLVPQNTVRAVAVPLATGLFTVAAALFLIWMSNRIRNINVVNNPASSASTQTGNNSTVVTP
jgi:protein involved in polysaccharide export with SLBB domain